MLASVCREQERIAKAEAARRETERILREQQAEVDAKKADMVKRDIQREKVTPLLLLYQPIQPPYSCATVAQRHVFTCIMSTAVVNNMAMVWMSHCQKDPHTRCSCSESSLAVPQHTSDHASSDLGRVSTRSSSMV